MPSRHIGKKGVKEYPILFARRPFCLSSAADFGLDFLKSALIDEDLALKLNLPIKNLQYQKFSLSEDKTVWSRLVGTIKVSSQIIEKGRAGKTFQLSGKIIRGLSEIIGCEAICDTILEEKLLSLPVSIEKPEKRVKKWLRNHGNIVPSQAPLTSHCGQSLEPPSTWPPSTATPYYSECRCDWSRASTHGTACCQHKGSCQHCIDNLADVATEVDNFSEGPPANYSEDVDINLIDHSDEDEVWCHVNMFDVHGNIINDGKEYYELQSKHSSEDIFVYRMTGDRLREFYSQNYDPFAAEESDLYELDTARRFLKMEFPEKPPIIANYGDLDVYLEREWKKLKARKKEAKKATWEDFKEEAKILKKKPSKWSQKEKAMTPA